MFPNPRQPPQATRSAWVTAYGWYFIARDIIIFLLPLEVVFGHSVFARSLTAIRVVVVFVTGVAIIRRKTYSLGLVWADIGLAVIYIAFERFTAGRFLARDLLAMVIPLTLALWYTKHMSPKAKAGLA